MNLNELASRRTNVINQLVAQQRQILEGSYQTAFPNLEIIPDRDVRSLFAHSKDKIAYYQNPTSAYEYKLYISGLVQETQANLSQIPKAEKKRIISEEFEGDEELFYLTELATAAIGFTLKIAREMKIIE